MRVSGLAYGDTDGLRWGRKGPGADFFDVKGDVESLLSPLKASYKLAEHPAMHPGRCAGIWLEGKQVGVVGELHPRWRQSWELSQAPVLFEIDLDAVTARKVAVFEPVPRFQAVERDIAIIVADGVTHASVMDAVHDAETGGLLRDATLFDVYKPKQTTAGLAANEKSLAVRLTLASADATLTDEQIEVAVKAVIDRIAAQLGGRLRA